MYQVFDYPLTYEDTIAWPRYNIIDSTFVVGDEPDTVWIENNLLYQDSARVFFYTDTTDDIWLDNYTYRNYTMAIDPPSLGVASFDGTDECAKRSPTRD